MDIVHRIGELAEEERSLERSHEGEELSPHDQERLGQIQVALDQCWDLLRRRRAQRDTGQDPDRVSVRPEAFVENYRG